MDDTENAAAAPAPVPEANGHVPEPPPLTGMQFRERPPDPVTGDIFLDVGPDLAGVLDDMGWFVDESWKGTWFPFAGKYVAILNKTHVGTDPDDPRPLRARVAREYGVSPDRVVVEYVPTDIFTEG